MLNFCYIIALLSHDNSVLTSKLRYICIYSNLWLYLISFLSEAAGIAVHGISRLRKLCWTLMRLLTIYQIPWFSPVHYKLWCHAMTFNRQACKLLAIYVYAFSYVHVYTYVVRVCAYYFFNLGRFYTYVHTYVTSF